MSDQLELTKSKEPKRKRTAAEVKAALHKRYAPPAFALFEEVGNGTGLKVKRHADAIGMSLWPSRGLEVLGFEVKVSRADWQKELADPAKADEIQKYCHRWYVVAANKAALLSEIPPNWGLMELRGNGLHTVKEAPLLEPKIDLGFVAALVRRAHETLEKRVQQARLEGVIEGETRGPAEHRNEVAQLNRKIERLETTISEFEGASGIKLDEWSGGHVGNALKKFLGFRHIDDPGSEYERVAKMIEGHMAAVESIAKACREEARLIRQSKAEAAE